MDEVLRLVSKPLMDEKEWAKNFRTIPLDNAIDTCVITTTGIYEPEPKELVPMLCKRCGGNIVNMTCECCGTRYEWR